MPDFSHVYVIVMENKEYSSIVGSSSAPYLNSLIARYGQATNLYAETHPSEPNYIALTSGGLQGTNSDGAYDLTVPNLFDQIDASGRTWHVYAQGYPGKCFRGSVSDAVVDGPGAAGEYARKHNPAISYTTISGNPTRCANITRLAGFDPAAADFEMIVPNQINDMHSSSVEAGDIFLRTFVPEITSSPAFADSVLFITWDEGTSNLNGGGHIATIVVSPNMTPGSRFEGPTTHYSMLRTIELAWGMPLLGEAQTATTLTFPGKRGRTGRWSRLAGPRNAAEVGAARRRAAPGCATAGIACRPSHDRDHIQSSERTKYTWTRSKATARGRGRGSPRRPAEPPPTRCIGTRALIHRPSSARSAPRFCATSSAAWTISTPCSRSTATGSRSAARTNRSPRQTAPWKPGAARRRTPSAVGTA